jgi:tetratricopeptide (TPR) repeat protein
MTSLRPVLLLCAGLMMAAPALAKFEKEQAKVDALVEQKRYLTAAEYIDGHVALKREPRFMRQMTTILTAYYSYTLDFTTFGVKDLGPGERLEDVRQTPGQGRVVGGNWEQTLYDAIKKNPKSAELNFAVGEYLSRASTCNCGAPRVFRGDEAREFPYLEKAYRAGLYDYWSLFRMGFHYVTLEQPDLGKAIEFYEKSLDVKPDNPGAHYNLALAQYQRQNYALAKKHAEQVIDQYVDPWKNADAFNVYARAEMGLGEHESAATHFQIARALAPMHPYPVTGLLELYRKTKQSDSYKQAAKDYIGQDYGNNFMFNLYVQFVIQNKMTDVDRSFVKELARQKFERPIEIGAVFYNLGRLAEIDGDKKLALKHYQKSLDALKEVEPAPPGAVEALTQMIQNVQKPDQEVKQN